MLFTHTKRDECCFHTSKPNLFVCGTDDILLTLLSAEQKAWVGPQFLDLSSLCDILGICYLEVLLDDGNVLHVSILKAQPSDGNAH